MVNNKLIKLANTNEIIFIFDNVENYSFIEKYICNRPESICVLTTTRNKGTIRDGHVHSIQLEPFSRHEAINYVVEVLNQNVIKIEEIENLVEIVGDENEVIPFNLNKVVSILSQPFFETFKKTRLEKIKNDPRLWLQTGFYDAFMENEKIAKILEFIPYFDPDSIDIELLAIMIGCDKYDSSLEKALVELLKNLLIKQSENGEQISVHRLLQKDLSEYFKKSKNKETTRKKFIAKIDETFSTANNGNWRNEYNTHIHAISLVEKKIIETDIEVNHQINEIKASIFNKIGAYYKNMHSRYQLALINAKKALKIQEGIFQGDNQDKATSYSNIGSIYHAIGDLENALEYSEKALEIEERLIQGDNQYKATFCNNIGQVYEAMGNFNKALEYSKKALEIRERLFQGDHQDNATSYSNKGSFYHAIGDLKNALEYSKKALEIRERLFQGDHQDKAASYSNIGSIYHDIGDLENALKYFTKALEIEERIFQGDNQYKATFYNNIGQVYEAMGKLNKALEYSKKALEIRERLFQGDHQDKATSYSNIGSIYHAKGDLEIRESLFTGDHQDKANSYNNIGSIYRDKGNLNKSLEYYTKALEIFEILFQGDHQHKAILYNNIGFIYIRMRDLNKSLEYFKKASDIQERLFQGDNQYKAIFYDNIGDVYQAKGDSNNALEYSKKASEIRKRLF